MDFTMHSKQTSCNLLVSCRDILDDDRSEDSSAWAVPWSDLMMTMFILFAVLFIYANAKRDLIQEVREDLTRADTVPRREIDTQEPLATMVRPVQKDVHAGFEVDKGISLQSGSNQTILSGDMENKHLVGFTLEHPVLFRHLSAELEPEGVAALTTVLPVIQKSNLDIQVLGYTDGLPVHTPVFAGNWELATARAMSVAHWLMHQGGISPSRITVSGRGSNDPRVPNISRENRIQNRRVEILLTRNRQGM